MAIVDDGIDTIPRELSELELARLEHYHEKTKRLRALFPTYFHLRAVAGERVKEVARSRDVLGEFARDRLAGRVPQRRLEVDNVVDFEERRRAVRS